MSSANSGVYSSTRMLYGLSVEKHAHWQFRILSRNTRIPVRSLLFSCFCMLSGTLLLFLVPNVMTLFTIRFNAGGDHGGFQLGYDPRGISGVSS